MKKILHHRAHSHRQLYLAALAGVVIVLIASALYIYNERVARAQHGTTDTTTSLIVRALQPSDHYLGDKNAPIALMVYSDLSCPYCKQFLTNTLAQLQAKYGSKLVVVLRNMPLESIHPRAYREAEAAECVAAIAGEDAFWKFVRADYAMPDYERGLSDAELSTLAVQVGADQMVFDRCLQKNATAARVDADLMEASVAGIANYSPTSVAKSANRATIVKGAYYPRFVAAVDYLLAADPTISPR